MKARASYASSSPILGSSNDKNLGVLYTGYAEKKNPISGTFKKRFVVLTHVAVHWFQREEGYDLVLFLL